MARLCRKVLRAIYASGTRHGSIRTMYVAARARLYESGFRT
jgi:hypothetical protein